MVCPHVGRHGNTASKRLNFLNYIERWCSFIILKSFFPATAVKPGIYGLAFTIGKWFLTDNLATVGLILMISSTDPHEILNLIKW